jgi:predicted ArsR family transcriptional regulator
MLAEVSYSDAVNGDDLDTIGVFAEPQRRRVYDQLQLDGSATVGELVTALGMGRTLVAFHLGKLVDAGFVEAVAPGPAAGTLGRPAQRYRISGREVIATVPDRRYDLLADVLLDGLVDQRSGESARESALRAARRRGADLAHRWAAGAAASRAPANRLESLLTTLGYAPRRDAAELVVRNCPFGKLRATHTGEVCPLNQALCDGYLDALELGHRLRTELRQGADSCCVVFSPTPS